MLACSTAQIIAQLKVLLMNSPQTDAPLPLAFALEAEDGLGRAGCLTLRRGRVYTPAFMPVGTAGSIKGVSSAELVADGAEIMLANTYHLMVRMGAETIARLGGLHSLNRWTKPILTDSGGFQVMSLAKLRTLNEEGVVFASHLDGKKFLLTPESAIEAQILLGAEVAMQLDECMALPAEREAVEAACLRSLRWAERARRAWQADSRVSESAGYGLFAIVQGGTDTRLRQESAETLVAQNFAGYAIGGLAVGEGQAAMLETLEATVPFLPAHKPRYLMGVGTPSDLVASVCRGVDLFDCVLPTRSGRTALAFVGCGTINLRNARHKDDLRPLDETCGCVACGAGYSRAWLHHLFRAGEILGAVLLTRHNLFHYQRLIRTLRRAICSKQLAAFATAFAAGEQQGERGAEVFPELPEL